MGSWKISVAGFVVLLALAGGTMAVAGEDTSESDSVQPETVAEEASEAKAENSDLVQDAQEVREELCEGPCNLVNTAADPEATGGDQVVIYGEALTETAIDETECPAATQAYEEAGEEVDGYIGGGCPSPEDLPSEEASP